MRPSALEIQSEMSHLSRRHRMSYAGPPSECPTRPLTSPPHRSKGSLRPSPHATSSEPRLYRKTFLLRKRGSKPSLQASSVPVLPGKCEDSSVSTPTSPGECGGTVNGSQESVRSGVRPRLQRQMAQSRKTFRFRKSKHGHAETQERQPQVAHIDVEPTRLPPV
ncbi:uncharacterized protein, partial [Cherax quadricarinatus]|uniref:uncharacterized protein n=1 Tax=Cherax quadricarinatus TaxID=27406 RepID=UPI00387E51F5